MSSEYSIHLHNRPLEGRVTPLGENYGTTIALISEAPEHINRERLTLFVKDDRLLEMSLLFHKIAQDLAALLPDVDACCRCVPGTPDDQCAEHGFGAFKIEKRTRCSCPLPGRDDGCPLHGFEAHKVKTGCILTQETCAIYGFAAPGVCPLCDEPSPDGEVHMDCAHREQCRVDAEAEANREPTDTIPIEEAAEHLDPPHRWG